ncbi:organic solute transporter subunit alpha-like [Mya arenaria]|uniref:organic solute transporter subunit alpha-like n=1 Tax=Mya arenaria TaxID=6604 RepID=UPI0022DF92FC|nr:organic solute transporter subunit alpha-like [Mya arenaria]
MTNCSNEFPSTEDYYPVLVRSWVSMMLMALACVLTVGSIIIFIESLLYVIRVNKGHSEKVVKVGTILGLHPVTTACAMLALLVPKSSLLVDLVAACYLSVCFYMFVSLVIEVYFGGNLVKALNGTKVKTAVPPCCCCCCCILKPRILTKRSLLVFRMLSLQVAFVQPVLLFIAAVLWTDGKYDPGHIDPAKATIYITVITTISTMLSIYGSLVVHRAAAPYLASFNCGIKWTCIQLVVILPNIQGLIFSILVANDLPPCENTRGPLVRGASLNHFLLVVEMFLLTLLARRAYRMDERDLPLPVTGQGKGEPEEQGLDPNTSGEWPVTDTVL